jgi:hypothetical protein
MKRKHISFSKIPQFRDVIRNINRQAHFDGLDSDGEPIYNSNAKNPIITFDGTVKLHGSNGGICFSDEGEIWYQSRKRILSISSDNNGFWQFCYDREGIFLNLLNQITNNIPLKHKPIHIISIFGEYCGQGINTGCAIHKLSKRFVIFAVKIIPSDGPSYYIDSTELSDSENDIYNINDFKTYKVQVDFNYPELSQNKFVELVNEVENECPVGKDFDVEGIGEGIVWTGYYEGIRHIFKTKGEKHSVSKVKKVVAIDVEKVNSIKEFVEYAVTENRLNQGVTEVFEDEEPTIQKMGDFLRWVMKDISEEEADTLGENGLTLKDVGRSVSNKSRPWFQNLLNKNAGLK